MYILIVIGIMLLVCLFGNFIFDGDDIVIDDIFDNIFNELLIVMDVWKKFSVFYSFIKLLIMG